ncbi:MAG: DUF5615 family PIN-like protein [Pyrinomonadaceae bacterium]
MDENMPSEAADILRSFGHDAVTVFDQSLVGESDIRIINVCREERRALLTLDLDFADVRTYPPQEFHGLIVFRLLWQDKPHVLDAVSRLRQLLEQEDVEHCLWIVDENRVRVRGEKST